MNAEYGTLAALQDAAVKTGYSCPHSVQDDQVKLAAESGHCSDADVFSTFVTQSDLQDQVDTYQEMNDYMREQGLDADPILVGPNWTVSGNEDELMPLMGQIGGKMLH